VTLFVSSGYRPLPPIHPDFADLKSLEMDLMNAVGGQQRFEEKLRSFFRSAIDEVIDTARTGRHFFKQLEKTEKTYLGTKFEILLRDWLQVPRGVRLDLLIGEREVDVKSTTGGGSGWMIPPEAIDQFCILLRVNEASAKCAFGLARSICVQVKIGMPRPPFLLRVLAISGGWFPTSAIRQISGLASTTHCSGRSWAQARERCALRPFSSIALEFRYLEYRSPPSPHRMIS
jgi:hypothetical protein